MACEPGPAEKEGRARVGGGCVDLEGGLSVAEVAVDEGAVDGSVAVAVVEVAVAVEGSVGAEPVGDKAAAMAAAAAGLEAMALSSSGDSVGGLVELSTGVVGAETTGRPEWSIEVSGTGERARMPRAAGLSALGLLAMAIN